MDKIPVQIVFIGQFTVPSTQGHCSSNSTSIARKLLRSSAGKSLSAFRAGARSSSGAAATELRASSPTELSESWPPKPCRCRAAATARARAFAFALALASAIAASSCACCSVEFGNASRCCPNPFFRSMEDRDAGTRSFGGTRAAATAAFACAVFPPGAFGQLGAAAAAAAACCVLPDA